MVRRCGTQDLELGLRLSDHHHFVHLTIREIGPHQWLRQVSTQVVSEDLPGIRPQGLGQDCRTDLRSHVAAITGVHLAVYTKRADRSIRGRLLHDKHVAGRAFFE